VAANAGPFIGSGLRSVFAMISVVCALIFAGYALIFVVYDDIIAISALIFSVTALIFSVYEGIFGNYELIPNVYGPIVEVYDLIFGDYEGKIAGSGIEEVTALFDRIMNHLVDVLLTLCPPIFPSAISPTAHAKNRQFQVVLSAHARWDPRRIDCWRSRQFLG
jgi:hypothetical protein